MWREQKIEALIRDTLAAGERDGPDIWPRYLATREDLERSILPYIATQEPGLSDHGIDHIANVMRNVGQVLGLRASGDAPATSAFDNLLPVEKLLLLLGCLLHDIGNILGRKGHNQVILDTWRKSGHGSFQQWDSVDRRTINAMCMAHTGKDSDGNPDTLKPLMADQHYFLGDQVRLGELAAVLRLADELAEGSQRTSRFLLFQKLYGTDNIDFHQYAHSTHVTIDRANGRIALDYDIELTDPFFGEGESAIPNLKRLLELIYKRVVKLEHERVFARHYAPHLLAFKEVSVRLNISRDHEPLLPFNPIILNDFNMRDLNAARLASLDESYDIPTILDKLKLNEGQANDL